MARGYLGDGYGSHGEMGRDQDDDREHGWREHSRRSHDQDWHDRDRGMMFRERDHGWSTEDRWNRESGRRDEMERGSNIDGADNQREHRRGVSAHPDDHYRSWRDRHMSELDRDYQDYCREREQQFHRDFDDWRNQRYGNPQPLRTGMTQTGLSADPSGMTEAATNAETPTTEGPDPMATATLGMTSRGRGRR